MNTHLFFRRLTHPYSYCASRYRDTFLGNEGPWPGPVNKGEMPAQKVVYCFWTGENEITPNRRRSLEAMERTLGVPVVLVTAQNLPQYVKREYPLHAAYPLLSAVHRSDYLRAYFMLHYGGGYMDIKQPLADWSPVFDRLNRCKRRWVAGYREIGKVGVPRIPGDLGKDIRRYWHLLPGNGSFICKPYTPLVWAWHSEQNARLDAFYPALKAHPGNVWGDNEGYPVPWARLQAEIFHPVCLKYRRHVICSPRMLISFENYR